MEVVVEVEVVVEAEVVVVEVVAAAEATEYLHRDVPEGHHQIAHEEAVDLLRAARRQRRRRRAGPRRRVGDRRGRVEDFDGEELRRRLTRVLLAVVEVGRAADGPLLAAQPRQQCSAFSPSSPSSISRSSTGDVTGAAGTAGAASGAGSGAAAASDSASDGADASSPASRLRRAHCEDEARRRRRLLVL